MNLTRLLNGTSNICYAPDDGGTSSGGGGDGGAPATATTDTNSNASASATAGTTAGQAAQASGDQSSAAASVPAGVGSQADTSATGGDFKTRLGDLAKDPALASFNSEADLAKAFVETKKLVGQKLGIPGPDATPEAKAAFYEAMGVPKAPEGYEFKAPDLPEQFKSSLYNEEHSKEWAKFFQENGVPKDVANKIRDRAFAEMKDDLEGLAKEIGKSDEDFGKMASKIYGDETKANAALQNVRTIIEKHVPADLKASLENLPNTALLIVAAAIRGETMELSGEDKTISKDNGVNNDGQSKDQLREEARRLQALPEYNSAFTAKGKTGHDEVVKRVKDIYDRIGKMG